MRRGDPSALKAQRRLFPRSDFAKRQRERRCCADEGRAALCPTRAAHPAALVEMQTPPSAPLFSFPSGRGCCLLRAVTTAIAIYCRDPRGGCRLTGEPAIAWAGRLGASPPAAAAGHCVLSSTGHPG